MDYTDIIEKEREEKSCGIELESDIFMTEEELINGKTRVIEINRDRIDRREIVHSFTNLRDTMTEEEKNDSGREEVVNFGSTFRSAQVSISPLESLVVGTDSLCEAVVDLNDPTRDHLVSIELSNLANKWFFKDNEKFHQFWRTAIGEGYICGGGAAAWDEKDNGLFPEYNEALMFPRGTRLDPDEMTYAFEKKEMTISEILELYASYDKDDEGDKIFSDAIESILSEIRSNIRGEGSEVVDSSDNWTAGEVSARDFSNCQSTTFTVWSYWEVRTDDDGDKYVSNILFTDACVLREGDSTNGRDINVKAIISQEEKAFDDPNDWLIMLVFDEEVGGKKKVDTLRGIAEAFYKPAVLIEELRNVEVEGAIQAARLTLQETENADPDEVLSFQLGKDLFAPKGVEVLQLPNAGGNVRPVVSDLMQTVSGITSTGHSNTGRGQELRQQALERQQNTAAILSNKTSRAYLKLDKIINLILFRALTLNPDKGTTDYRVIKGFQTQFDKKLVEIYGLIDETDEDEVEEEKTAMLQAAKLRKALGEREYGKFNVIEAKARRAASGIDRFSETENAGFILRLIETGRVPAQNIPALLQRATAYQTQNTDIAMLVAEIPEPIQSDQRERAAAEWATIKRRAAAGEVYPIGPRDVDTDHVESHTTDLIADVNANGLRPWDQLAVAEFSACVSHIGEHIARMQRRPEFRQVAASYMQELQAVIGAAGGIIQTLEEQRAAQENQDLDPSDQLKIAQTQKVYAEIEMMGRKWGVNLADKRDIARNRVTRAQQNQDRLNLLTRQQLTSEIQADREFSARNQQPQSTQ